MKRKWIIRIVVINILAGLWIWRFCSLNAYWDSVSTMKEQKIYQLEEIVPIGPDRMDKYAILNGYSIRADSMEIITIDEYLEKFNISEDDLSGRERDKIILVYVTLFNSDCDEAGVTLTNLQMHGIDSYIGMDYELLRVSNPVLEGNLGIHLPHDSEYKLILPYNIYKNQLLADWHHLDTYTIYLHVTSGPVEKDIQVQ